MIANHTPQPWPVGEYRDTGGYDCMTGAIRVGPVVLDGADYGQELNQPIAPEALARMTADANLIGAAGQMLDALRQWQVAEKQNDKQELENARRSRDAAIIAARGAQ